jgi:hypothetical protein
MELTTRQISAIIACCLQSNYKYEIKLFYTRDDTDKFHYEILEIIVTGNILNISNYNKNLLEQNNVIYIPIETEKMKKLKIKPIQWRFISCC